MSRNSGKDRGRKAVKARAARRVLILCEDAKSSRDYLARFPHDKDQVEIDCIGTGMNTDSLMEDAIRRTCQARESGNPYEQVWVVFDKDDFPQRNFNRVFDLARGYSEIVSCWSNECFELWYLLHFSYRDTGIGRREIWKEISRMLRKKYSKADSEVFELLDDKLEDALRHAARLAFQNARAGTPWQNPSTQVHRVVQMLRSFDPSLQ